MIGAISVLASGTVATGRGHHALIHVLVAESSCVADRAGAREVQKVGRWRTLCSVKTSVGRTGIEFVLAVATGVGQLADALVVVHQIDAGTAVLARVVGTVVNVGFAVDTGVTC